MILNEKEPNLEEDYLDNLVAFVEEADDSDFENLDDSLENNNFGTEKKKNSDCVVIYKNYRWWWKRDNKDGIKPTMFNHYSSDTKTNNYGAVLCQEVDGEVKTVAYFSKQMNIAQTKYSTSEKELLAIVMSVEHFHSFLYGRFFTVRSDHQPLKWLLTKKDPISSRLARWIVYKFEIRYKPRASNGNADALSRMPEPLCTIDETDVPIDDFEDHVFNRNSILNLAWIKKQLTFKVFIQEDPKSPMQKALQSNLNYFVIQDDKLFYIKRTYENTILLYVIPDNAVEEILRVGHCSLLSGHLGIKKTMEKILSRFYLPGLKAIKTCDMCQRVKIIQPKRMELFHFLLSTAEIIADAIISSWICLYSIPEYILSDRGKNFQSMLLDLIYEKLDIKQLGTTAYHPECDGQSESFIRTLNRAEHSTTGYSPHELVFGEPPHIPIDLVFDLSEEVNTHQEFDYPNLQILFDHEDELNPKIDPFVLER
ncbi:unnamed protein product [Brachionus calyciflorus]|uniref:Integrase catalytic domain-containing protein n=1 Tax=Brachionus calyciflorus TaxID=104777 RepID=A0A814IRK3_9BILA|nr:unnamed protein product [Brachionus calyciflorus]